MIGYTLGNATLFTEGETMSKLSQAIKLPGIT